jgi:hypothetical protein
MRFVLILSAVLAGAATPLAAQVDDGFDDRGYDRNDRAPDWNYRRGEWPGKGAYYDGGRYGPRGLLSDGAALDPWLAEPAAARAVLAGRTPGKANRWFRKLADRDSDARLTDAEIEAALAAVKTAAR